MNVLRREYEGQDRCSVAATLEIVGDRWTWLLIRDAFLGLSKFAEFRESLGIAPNVLSDRLERLVADGIFERVRYCDHPPRFEYRLTEKGSELFVCLNALRQWGDRHLRPEPMRLLVRKSDGLPVIAALVPAGSQVLRNDEVEIVPGPGFPHHDD